MATIIQMPKPPGEPEKPSISQLELSECVVIENEIRLLRSNLKKKRAYLRRCLKDGMEVEGGPLESFAARIARGCFPGGGRGALRELTTRFGTVAANLPTCYTGLMSSNAQKRVKGCGKTGQIFTLYHVSIFDGTARPLAQGFKHLDCGCCVSTFQKMTYGIVLCLNCADHLGFPPLPVAKTESAKPSRP